MPPEVPSARPDYGEGELENVRAVLNSGHTAEGPRCRSLESSLSEEYGQPHSIVASSGTTALHLLFEGLGIGETDEVVLPSYVCQAVLNAVRHAGAEPILADVDPDTFCLTANTVKPVITQRTSAIILVHSFGYPADAPDLFDLDVPVIEDLCHAVGAEYDDGTPVGQRGVAGFGSLYATKQIAAGYGGYIVTGDENLTADIRDLKQYDQRETFRVTYNYSLSDLLAGVAEAQLEKFSEHLARRRDVANQYDRSFESIPSLKRPERPTGHACYRYVVKVDDAKNFEETMRDRSIEVKRPVHHPLHHDINTTKSFPVSDRLHERARLIPLLDDMTEAEVEHVVTSTTDILGG